MWLKRYLKKQKRHRLADAKTPNMKKGKQSIFQEKIAEFMVARLRRRKMTKSAKPNNIDLLAEVA